MKLRYTVAYEVIFDVPADRADDSLVIDELGVVAESGVRTPKLPGFVVPAGTKILEFNKGGHEFWGEVEE